MALLEMGANMQSNSYFPGCYFTRNLEGNVNASVWTRTIDNKMFNNGLEQNGLSTCFAADHHFGYNKVVMKEIMLKHEAIFRDQIHELHRLYRRQRELMAETKRNKSYKHSLMAKTSHSDSVFCQISSECFEKTCQVPTFPWKESTYNKLTVSVGEKMLSSGKKTPALEFPTREYLDSEKGPSLMEKKFPQLPKKAFLGYNDVNSLCEIPTPDPFSRKTEVIADLNEPFWPEQEAASGNGQGKTSLNSSPPALCAKSLSYSIKSLCKEPKSAHELPILYYLEQSCSKSSAERKDYGLECSRNKNGSSSNNINFEPSIPSVLPIAVQALPCLNSSMSIANSFKSSPTCTSKLTSAGNLGISKSSHPFSEGENICKIDVNSEQVLETELEKGIVYCRGQIDLNVCINDELSLTCSPSTEIDLEAPASPENKEQSPLRGESDENPLETPFLISGLNDDELVKIAAETLVLISSFRDQTLSRSISINSIQPSFELLHWLSGIITSVVGNPNEEIEVVSNDMNYFEAMTLKLKDTKTEGYIRKSNSPKEEGKGISLSPRKGRTRRGKDFQSVLLPSLTSLSRYKVTEDLQTVRSLVEETGVLTENAGRIRLGRGKRRHDVSDFDHTQTMTGSVLKRVCSSSIEGRIEEGRFIGWGKINGRRRDRRYPASNIQLVLD